MTKKSKLLPEPLYRRAEIELTNRIATGKWGAGLQLPNEFALADELGVSQGTIRKALVAMEKRGLLVRSSGRGTIVSKSTPEEALYAFFRLRNNRGEMVVPSVLHESIELRPPTVRESEVLGKACRTVAYLTRVRENDQLPFVLEKISFDTKICSGIVDDLPLPGSLYPYLHERFGILVMNVHESIGAVVADENKAKILAVEIGTPLLQVVRIAYDLSNRPVELRHSFYRTDFATYQIQLSRSEG